MSKNSDRMIQSLYGERWQTLSTPAAGTTCVASVSAPIPTRRHHLDNLWYSIRNQVGAGNIIHTVAVNVNHASIAGTLIAQVEHMVGPSQTANVGLTNLGLFGKRGGSLFVSMSTVIASVTQRINIAGWTEDVNG